jgi:hypothetical protein
MYAQISDHHNSTHIIFTAEAIFHTTGRVNRCNCITWGSESPREHLEHEQHRPKSETMTHADTHVIGMFFFNDIIKSN